MVSSEERRVKNGVDLRMGWKTKAVSHRTNAFFNLEGPKESFGELGVVVTGNGGLTARA